MDLEQGTLQSLRAVPGLRVLQHEPLSHYTRFGIGGPADIFVETDQEDSFTKALQIARRSDLPDVVIGAGTNLIVSDAGFRGVVLRFNGNRMEVRASGVYAEAGAVLWDLVDFTIAHGLRGLQTMAAIPGWVGAAIYGNAGAYGHSISEIVHEVRFTDGQSIRSFTNAECQFRYRESIFKQHKNWILFSTTLSMDPADPRELRRIADGIVAVRNEKFPPTMKCAGSIFKNLLFRELPESLAAQIPERVIREGKVPSAYFLEQVGAKGMREGGIEVAPYHANLIYNTGEGTAEQLCSLIRELKTRVEDRFGLTLEEEVQYVGFPAAVLAV